MDFIRKASKVPSTSSGFKLQASCSLDINSLSKSASLICLHRSNTHIKIPYRLHSWVENYTVDNAATFSVTYDTTRPCCLRD